MPESTTSYIYVTVGALVDSQVLSYLVSTLQEANARAAYEAAIEFTKVLKADLVTSCTRVDSLGWLH